PLRARSCLSHVRAEGREGAPARHIAGVSLGQVLGNDELEPFSSLLTRDLLVGIQHRVQSTTDRLRAQVLFVLELTVEGARGEAGRLHNFVDRRSVGAVPLQEGHYPLEDLPTKVIRAALPRSHLHRSSNNDRYQSQANHGAGAAISAFACK